MPNIHNAWEFELDNGDKGVLITYADLKQAKQILNTKFHHRKLIAIERAQKHDSKPNNI